MIRPSRARHLASAAVCLFVRRLHTVVLLLAMFASHAAMAQVNFTSLSITPASGTVDGATGKLNVTVTGTVKAGINADAVRGVTLYYDNVAVQNQNYVVRYDRPGNPINDPRSFNFVLPVGPGTHTIQLGAAPDLMSVGYTAVYTVTAADANGAVFVSQNVPSTMAGGQTYPVSVTLRNSGTKTWIPGGTNGYSLGTQNPDNNAVFGLGRVAAPGAVAPGATATFDFTVTAPESAGTYNFQWRMVQELIEWFGDITPNVAVNVTPRPANAAAFVSQDVPGAMRAGQPYMVTVRMLNTGSATWTDAAAYRLGAQNPQDNRTWSGRAFLSASVAPGQVGVFTFPVTAPSKPGTYNFQWQMLREQVGWFGAMTANVPITVASGPGPSVTLAATPTNVRVAAAQTQTVSFTGSGSRAGGTVSKLELFQYSGHGYGTTPVLSATGASSTLAFANSLKLPAGVYAFRLRATDGGGVQTDSEQVFVNITNSALLGSLGGVRSNAAGTPELFGWACQPGDAAALSYKVLLDAPSFESGGVLLTQGTANLASERDNASVAAQCGSGGHHFVVDLGAYTASHAGRSLYLLAENAAATASVTLPCADNSCTMPGSLRVALASPAPNAMFSLPQPAFLKMRLTNVSGSYDEVGFVVNGEFVPAAADGAAGEYSAQKYGLAVSAAPYQVYARVRQGNTTLRSVEVPFYMGPGGSTTLTAPAANAVLTVGAPQLLSASFSGSAATVMRFYAGGTQIASGINNGGVWTASWTPAAAGAVALDARAYDAFGTLLAQSAAVNVTVAASTGGSSTAPIAVAIEPPHLGEAPGGSLPGSLGAGGNGESTYNMELAVPPGTAGLQPQLSLSYNSSGPNGNVGLGWTLGGWSSIHRCGKTIAQDGVNARIGFDRGDRLCLDGKRLVLVNLAQGDDNYWADNAEYRTEIDSFSRIYAQGAGNQRSFKVESKDGRVSTYGSTASSFVQAVVKPIQSADPAGGNPAGPQPAAKNGAQSWALDRTADRVGNYISYSYEQDLNTGEHRPSFIRYGGKGMSAHAAVELVHGDRPDAWKRYIDESRSDLRKRITNIRTYVGGNLDGDVKAAGTLVRDYTLAYKQSATSGRSLLTSVKACAVNPQSGAQECLPATSFAWGEPDPNKRPGFESKGIWSGAPNLNVKNLFPAGGRAPAGMTHADYFAFADLDGDGFGDVLEKRVASVLPADWPSTEARYREAVNPLEPGTKRDAYRYFRNNGASGGSGFTVYNYKLSTNEAFTVLDAGDFDGDGAVDVLVSTAGATRICLSPLARAGGYTSPIIFACQPNWPAFGSNSARFLPYVFDVLGDGRLGHYGTIQPDASVNLYLRENQYVEPNPPDTVIKVTFGDDVMVYPLREYVGFEQMVDFSGIGKSYDVRWTEPSYITTTTAGGQTVRYWVNLQPQLTMTGFGMPGTPLAAVAPYRYKGYQNPCTDGGCLPPYEFERPLQGAGLTTDFNGSGYNGLLFGFKEVARDGSLTRAEATLCLSTGRGLDCGIRRKFSGAQYRAIVAVGNFYGDGSPSILVEDMIYPAGAAPKHSGQIQMCRITGDDTTAGAGANDDNMRCVPWTGLTLPITRAVPSSTAPSKLEDQVYVMDLLGTGRPQLVYYHSGKFNTAGDGAWIEDGRWEVFAPVDVAVEGQALDRIHQVTNGVGAVSTVQYVDGLVTGAVSRTGKALSYPLRSSMGAGKVVRRLQRANGNQAPRVTQYSYQDPVLDQQGRGSQGYATVTSLDIRDNVRGTGIATTTTRSQSWPYTGMALQETVTASDGVVLSDTRNTPALAAGADLCGGTPFLYTASSTVTQKDLGGVTLSVTTTSKQKPDCWGNVGVQTVSVAGAGGPFATTVTQTYKDDSAKRWGLPTTIATTKSDPGAPTLTRTISYDYDANYGYVNSQTMEPGNAALEFKTVYDRSSNVFGLVNKETQSWRDPVSAAVVSRAVATTYDANGRYPTVQTNAKGHVVTRDYYPGTGAARSTTDANKLTVSSLADGYGRVYAETAPDGNQTRTYLKTCVGCVAGGATVRIVERFNGASRIAVPELVYMDNLGRPLLTKTWNFNGTATVVGQRYDDLGRAFETDQPSWESAAAQLANRQLYDDLDRPASVVTRDEGGAERALAYRYAGLATTITNARLKQRVETRNAIGQLKTVVDPLGNTTQFFYDAFGNLVKTIDPQNNEISVAYNLLGRRTDLRDPDLGWIHYDVDPAGRTYRQISPKQRKAGGVLDRTLMEFDELDRMTARFDSGELESHWEFDTGTAAKGKLAEAYTGQPARKDYRRIHTYDVLGRPSMTQQLLFDGAYTEAPTYDAWSRVVTQTYRRGTGAAKVFGLRYNAFGYASRTERGNLVLAEVKTRDAANRSTVVALGNGLTEKHEFNEYSARPKGGSLVNAAGATVLTDGYAYNVIGSVSNRTQSWLLATGATSYFQETFDYDDLERIKTSQVAGQEVQTFDYYASGNIKSKPLAGTYSYPEGTGAVRPHAVSSTTLLGNFVYDDNGNMLSGAGRSAAWNSFDMPLTLTKGASTSAFNYGPEHQRLRQDRSDGAATTRTVYAGAQEVEINGTNVTVKTYWPGGIGVEIDRPGASASELNWIHDDRLGSVIGMTGQTGALREGTMYDAWGKRRSLDGKPLPNATSTPDTLDGKTDNKGFTGHEMLDQLDLVHMNGRVYDPLVARFLSADPLLQNPQNGQSYNRYSYVLNNPTNMTDPTGFACTTETGSHICTPDPVTVRSADGNSFATYKNKTDADKAIAQNGGRIVAVGGKLVDAKSNPTIKTTAGESPSSAEPAFVARHPNQRKDFGYDVPYHLELLGEYFSAKKAETGNFLYGNLAQWTFGLADNLDTAVMIAGTLKGTGGRLLQDKNVNPIAPAALPTNRPIGSSPAQNADAQRIVSEMKSAGYTDIRVNQQQTNALGSRVGINRPDVSGTNPAGVREHVEIDRSSSSRGELHKTRILSNDPKSKVELKTVD
jgi:RHS repeat-associated protein